MMRKLGWIALSLLVAGFAIEALCEDKEEAISIEQLPAAVRTALEAKTAGCTIVEIEKESEDGKVVYEAEYKTADGKKCEIELSEDGTILEEEDADEDDEDDGDEEEVKVSLDQVPAAVKAAVEKAVANGTLIELTKETEDGKVVYEAEYKTADGKKREIEMAEDGTVLEEEDADEDDEDDEDEEEEEVKVSLDQVPAAVKAAVEKAVANGTPIELTKETEDGKVVYEAEYKTADGKKREIEMAEDGTVLEEEDDDDDD